MKYHFKTIAIFLVNASILGVIIAGLAGCSIYSTEPVSPGIVQTSPTDTLQPPKVISLSVDHPSLSVSELDLNIQAKVLNSNPFSINIGNPTVKIQGMTGLNYSESNAPGSQIKGIAVQTFNFNTTVPNTAFNEQDLSIQIDFNAEYGSSILPVSDTSTFDLRETLNKLYIEPTVSLQAKFEKISWNSLTPQAELQVEGTIDNPNPFNMIVNGITLAANDNQGIVIGSSSISGNFTVAPNSNYSFEKIISLPVQTLNEPRITVVASMPTTSLYSMNSLKGEAFVEDHNLEDLIEVPKMVLDAQYNWIDITPLPSLVITVKTSLTNSTEYNLTNGDPVLEVEKPGNTILSSTSVPSNVEGVPANSTKEMTNVFTLRPDNLGDMGGDATINASVQIGIANVNETIPVTSSMVLNVDPFWSY